MLADPKYSGHFCDSVHDSMGTKRERTFAVTLNLLRSFARHAINSIRLKILPRLECPYQVILFYF